MPNLQSPVAGNNQKLLEVSLQDIGRTFDSLNRLLELSGLVAPPPQLDRGGGGAAASTSNSRPMSFFGNDVCFKACGVDDFVAALTDVKQALAVFRTTLATLELCLLVVTGVFSVCAVLLLLLVFWYCCCAERAHYCCRRKTTVGGTSVQSPSTYSRSRPPSPPPKPVFRNGQITYPIVNRPTSPQLLNGNIVVDK